MKVYLDMDGVLTNFHGACLKLYNLNYTDIKYPPGDWSLHNYIPDWNWNLLDYDFWKNMEWMPDGKDILNLVEDKFGKENIAIVTSPTLNKDCIPGKLFWLEKNLPQYKRRYAIIPTSNDKDFGKHFFCHSDALLIDDASKNVNKFIAAGGNGILVPRYWNEFHKMDTMNYLRNFLLIKKYK